MKCAVVAFPDEDKKPHGLGKWLAGYKNNVFEIEVVHMEEPITVCLLPFTEQELREKKAKKQEKVFLRCIRELQSRNVTCVFLTDRVLMLAPVAEFERCFRLPVGKAVFDLMLNDALKWCAKKRTLTYWRQKSAFGRIALTSTATGYWKVYVKT